MLPLVAALLLAATDPAPAEPPSEALIDRFMAVIPDAERLDRADRAADPAELARLVRLNPGKEAEIRPVLEAYAACESPISQAMSRDGLRFVARRLGSAKLERLIAFYEGEDFRRFDALGSRIAAGETLSAEDQAEIERIVAAYPLQDFNAAMNGDMMEYFAAHTEQLEAIDRCVTGKEAALARLGIAMHGPQPEAVAPPNRLPNTGQ